MQIQYLIVSVIVLAIVFWQICTFFKNRGRINRLRKMFPANDKYMIDAAEGSDNISISSTEATVDFKNTLEDINAYLEKNKNKSTDYHILKEIVNRNTQEVEEEVDTMLPAPLYLGLMATIAGVAIGVAFFAWTDLADLLTGASVKVDGIKTLLTDVSIAMVASFLGVLFTKISTSDLKGARSTMSQNKNRFLTWIQTELMPNLSDSLSGALTKMTQDLNEFNRTFATNTKELKNTLSLVEQNYEGQLEILDAIEKIKINKVAKANIEVYDKLQGCTQEIERLFEHLGHSEQYISSVVSLNQQLGSIEERTRIFEEVGNYFQNEIEYVKDRQGQMRQHISSLDSILLDTMSNLGESVKQGITNFAEVFQCQNQSIQKLIEEQQYSLVESLTAQQSVINQKISAVNDPFSKLNDTFTEIGHQARRGIDSITNAFEQQNQAIEQMLSRQRETMENEIANQRIAIQHKINDIPDQFKSLSQLAQAFEILNRTLEKQQIELESQGHTLNSILSKEALSTTGHNSTSNISWLNWILAWGVCGSFILLLAMIIIQLFGITLNNY